MLRRLEPEQRAIEARDERVSVTVAQDLDERAAHGLAGRALRLLAVAEAFE